MSKIKIESDGRDALERLCKDLFEEDDLKIIPPYRKEQEFVYTRMDSVLSSVIQQRIATRAVPISMRKLLLYNQSLAS